MLSDSVTSLLFASVDVSPTAQHDKAKKQTLANCKLATLKREVFLMNFCGFQVKVKGVYIKYMTADFYAEPAKSRKKTNAKKRIYSLE